MKLDANTKQRFLLNNIDIVSKHISASRDVTEKNIYLHSGEGAKRNQLTPKEVADILFAQRNLVTSAGAVNIPMSKELFSNRKSNQTIDLGYIIKHYIFLSLNKNESAGIEQGVYYFDIDEVNALNEGRFFISSVNIENNSKDAFTNRSNYAVKIKIFFTLFEDLLKPLIFVKNISNDKIIEIPLINIVYPYFFKTTGSERSVGRDIKHQNGIMLLQELVPINNDGPQFFKETKNVLQTETISKNYHLTNKQHVINAFGGNDPIYKQYENEIIIDYIAFESDTSIKIFNNNLIPNPKPDLYEVFYQEGGKVESTLSDFTIRDVYNEIQKANESLERLIDEVRCYNAYEGALAKGLPPDFLPPDVDIDQVNSEITKLKEQLSNLKFIAKRELLRYIISKLNFWEYQVSADLLITFRELTNSEAFRANFSWGEFLGATFAGAGAGAVLGSTAGFGVGALPGAIAGTAVGAAGDFAAAFRTTYLYTATRRGRINEFERPRKLTLREVLNYKPLDAKNNKAPSDDLTQDNRSITPSNPGAELLSQETRLTEDIKTEILKAIEQVDTPEFQRNLPIALRFTTFGEIAKLLTLGQNPSQKVKTYFGGNAIYLDEANKYFFYNYSDIPINLNILLNFLKKEIMDKDELKLNPEILVRDAFESLVRNFLKFDNVNDDPIIRETIPAFLRMHSYTLKSRFPNENDAENFTGCDNFLNPTTTISSKVKLLKNSNLKFTQFTAPVGIAAGAAGNILQRVYFFMGEDELKYHNFFKTYEDFAQTRVDIPALDRTNFSSKFFQQWIHDTYLIPCLLLNYVAMEETILKQKQIVFSRIDNSNLMLGTNLDDNNTSILRLPYSFNTKLKAYMTFFLDISSYVFVSPPYAEPNSGYSDNTFGYGGLYLVTKSSFEYSFQKLVNGKPTIPNLEAAVSITGRRISDGLGVTPKAIVSKEKTLKELCKDVAKKRVIIGPPSAGTSTGTGVVGGAPTRTGGTGTGTGTGN